MPKWWIGCSGFHYTEWKEIFYPKDLPKSKWFDYYCEHFNTLELNVTFYRFPQLKFLQNWYKKSPSSFCFSVKAPRLITHYKKFSDSKRLLSDFYGTINNGLQDKLGCVLFQLPPHQAYNERKLEQIVESLDPAFNNVVEFRHPSWWDDTVYKELARHKISFCSISHPEFPDGVIQNTSIVYYRFHGVPQLYKSKYKNSTLHHIADEIKNSDKIRHSYIYFNNSIDASAIKNAQQMKIISQSDDEKK